MPGMLRMEILQCCHHLHSYTNGHSINSLKALNLATRIRTSNSNRYRCFSAAANGKAGVVSKEVATQLKEGWLDSLSCPFPINPFTDSGVNSLESGWVIGVDPDVSGAIAVLRPVVNGDDNAYPSAQVFDSPHVKVLIGKSTRRRLDAKSIVHLLKSFNAPVGTTAYLEQSIPFPQDGKQGWWSGGFGYGLWIGVLVASGFSVVPIPSAVWKNEFHLCGSRSSKDDSRELASTFFPSMYPLLRRKKDHGRAEALLIAAYGKGLKLDTNRSTISEVAVNYVE